MRLRMALNSLFGAADAPMIMTVTPAVSWKDLTIAGRRSAEADLTTFLQAHPDLDVRMTELSASR